MIDATRCPDPDCNTVAERCCADCVRAWCDGCGATIDWNAAEPIARPLQQAAGGETA